MGPKQYTSQQFSLTSRPVIMGLGYLEDTVSEGNGSVFKLSCAVDYAVSTVFVNPTLIGCCSDSEMKL